MRYTTGDIVKNFDIFLYGCIGNIFDVWHALDWTSVLRRWTKQSRLRLATRTKTKMAKMYQLAW